MLKYKKIILIVFSILLIIIGISDVLSEEIISKVNEINLNNSLEDGTLTSSIKFSDVFSEADDVKILDGGLEITNDFENIKLNNFEGIKHNINLQNNMLSATPIDYSLKLDIETHQVRWNGTIYNLTSKPQRLQPYNETNLQGKLTNKLLVPNIFFGENNARINFKDIGNQGGYALIYNETVELRIDSINILPNTNHYIDPTYYNQTDGFSISDTNTPVDITTNGSDFWIVDYGDDWVFHYLSDGTNVSDGFSSVPYDPNSPQATGITLNGTYFWFVGRTANSLTSAYFSNKSVYESFPAKNYPMGIATNGTYVFVTDDAIARSTITAYKINSTYGVNEDYHINSTNYTGSNGGLTGLTTNGSDLFISDSSNNTIFHTDLWGNLIDTINTTIFGSTGPSGLVAYEDDKYEYESGEFDEFYLLDGGDKFVYHILTTPANNPPYVDISFPLNNTFEKTSYINFTYNVSDADADPVNCSFYLNDVLNLTDTSVTQTINQSFNLTTMSNGNYNWTVGCFDGTDWANSTNYNFTIALTPSTYCDFNITACGDYEGSWTADSTYCLNTNITAASGNCLSVNAVGVTLDCMDYDITNTGTAIYGILGASDLFNIRNCNIYNFNSIGIYLTGGENVSIINITGEDMTSYCIDVEQTYNLSIENVVCRGSSSGIAIDIDSLYATVINVSLDSSFRIAGNANYTKLINSTIFNSSNYGVYQRNSYGSTINNVILTGNEYGIYYNTGVYNSTIYGNIIKNNSYGVYMRADGPSSIGNLHYDNFFNNTQNVYTSASRHVKNYWNTTYSCILGKNILGDDCIGGNYFSNYVGIDDGNGAYPNNNSLDGVGDTNLPFNSSGQIAGTGDFLPLLYIAPPVIILEEPENNLVWDTSYINFTYNVSSLLSGIDTCYLYINNGTWYINSTDTSITESINQTFNLTIQDKSFSWMISCNDTINTWSNSTVYNILEDITPPVYDETTWTPINYYNSTSPYINFTYNVTDATSSVDTCNLYINNGTWYINSTDSSITEGINQTFNLTLEDGNYLWKVGCNDTLNNLGNSSVYNITIDTILPTITLDEPINNTNLVGVNQNLKYTPTDTNLNNCTLTVYSAGDSYSREIYKPTSGTQIIESFTSNEFIYAKWYWKVECSDTAENIYTTPVYNFITHESSDTASGGTISATGGIVCGGGFIYNPMTGQCGSITQEDEQITPIKKEEIMIVIILLIVFVYLISKSGLINKLIGHKK